VLRILFDAMNLRMPADVEKSMPAAAFAERWQVAHLVTNNGRMCSSKELPPCPNAGLEKSITVPTRKTPNDIFMLVLRVIERPFLT
jgi:hypothetical protein